ncbi:hypothetical protein HMPREF0658_1695 [Hoylesella marshii DSM 16973 = JCM 13450]|uniref:Uncharacterized protein n=1 Tax=Hoylesella marshii DSM 16973 = JCM 13450 TaxID=862515 RepID=E0NU42_9BACT|nr:hypothetical protein HMPREF0658_1695 [Hoylesella marshii DSM 16973 = JCM 13450]
MRHIFIKHLFENERKRSIALTALIFFIPVYLRRCLGLLSMEMKKHSFHNVKAML